MTTTEQLKGFDPSEFDLEGTPTLNGDKATVIIVGFEPFNLDHTDAEHMELAGKLEQGETLTLMVTAKATKRQWSERPDADQDKVGRAYRLTIRDITT